MPELLPVPTLYTACLNVSLQQFHQSLQRSSKSAVELRKIAQSLLHAGIRQHLIYLAIKKYRTQTYMVLDLLSIFLDKGIQSLLPLGEDNDYISVDPCTRLFAILDEYRATGLRELCIKVDLHSGKRRHVRMFGANFDYVNTPLYNVLRSGLACSLRDVTLNSMCDNEILRLLGRHAPHLKNLDIASSWMVDDGGLRHLCFNNPETCAIACPLNDLLDAASLADISFGISPDDVNPCCRTLSVVRIQDTNTTEVSVAILLLFLPNLQSLGGFIYYRNVGDAILSLIDRRDLSLNLTALWDTSLPPSKASLLNKAAPRLTNLYTQASQLTGLVQLVNITHLTLDFDFNNYLSMLEQYLMVHGAKLRKLVLVDQRIYAVDVGMLADTCPNLEELGATLEGGCRAESKPFLPKLTTCRVRLGSHETFTSLLVYARKLTTFEVFYESDQYLPYAVPEHLDDSAITSVLARNPPENLQLFVVQTPCQLSIQSATNLARFCPRLAVLVDLILWLRVCDEDVEAFAAHIRSHNLKLAFYYRGILYPRSRQCDVVHEFAAML